MNEIRKHMNEIRKLMEAASVLDFDTLKKEVGSRLEGELKNLGYRTSRAASGGMTAKRSVSVSDPGLALAIAAETYDALQGLGFRPGRAVREDLSPQFVYKSGGKKVLYVSVGITSTSVHIYFEEI